MNTKSRKQVSGPIGWTPPDFRSEVAVVTGASRGAGRGIALALGETGATVYVAGRTVRGGPKPPDGAPGTVQDTADEVTARGGKGIPVRADCTVESEVAALFERVRREQNRLDILANSVWDVWKRPPCAMGRAGQPFWEAESMGWEPMLAGAYSSLLASRHAARLMAPRRRGLIVHVTEPILEKYDKGGPLFWMFWMLAHRAVNRIVEAMKSDLVKRGIAAIALAPGWMRTERVMMHTSEKEKKSARFGKSESTEYVGRAVASLAADAKVLRRAGKLLFVGDLAAEYGFKDSDGRAVPNFYKEMKMI